MTGHDMNFTCFDESLGCPCSESHLYWCCAMRARELLTGSTRADVQRCNDDVLVLAATCTELAQGVPESCLGIATPAELLGEGRDYGIHSIQLRNSSGSSTSVARAIARTASPIEVRGRINRRPGRSSVVSWTTWRKS